MTDEHTRQQSWPHDVDGVLGATRDWRTNASVNWGGDTLYIDGYKTAADTLVNHVARDRYTSDTLVYPIVFSYRQYLELMLKALLEEASPTLPHRRAHPRQAPAARHLAAPTAAARAMLAGHRCRLAAIDGTTRPIRRRRPASSPSATPQHPRRAAHCRGPRLSLSTCATLPASSGATSTSSRAATSSSAANASAGVERGDDHAADHAAYHAA